jgi:hypothetical protein
MKKPNEEYELQEEYDLSQLPIMPRGRYAPDAEKVASLNVLHYLAKRAERGSREKLMAVLAKAPDIEPDEHDRL